MKKRGFTLLELLAVVVILAVLALITIPIVTNLIKNSKKEAFRISVQQVNDNVLFHYTKDWLIEGMTEDKVIDFDTNQNVNLLNLSGKLPSSGTISITPQGKIAINVNDGVFCAVKTITEEKIQVGEIKDGICELTGEEVDTCPYAIGYTWNFDYISSGTDRSQEFSVPCDGNYKLEVWGAQGGSYNNKKHGGYGGYSTGEIELTNIDKLYINVGGAGTSTTSKGSSFSGGYNGGGSSYIISSDSYGVGSGGGATHIALESGVLSTFENKQDKLLIVGAGGGGAGYVYFASDNSYYSDGGSGGGYIGGSAKGTTTWYLGAVDCPGATQSYVASATGGESNRTAQPGTFGQGGYLAGGGASNTGGGGGYYGGTGCRNYGGSGGSGYIGNNKLTNKYMYCYDCSSSTDENTYTLSGKSSSSIPKSTTAKEGNGYARIIYLGKKKSNSCNYVAGMSWDYDYKEANGNGVEQSFNPSCTGYYKLEVWGAQGGTVNSSYPGGYGGYSKGTVKLTKDVPVYINVGGQGKKSNTKNVTFAGGYNGGGSSFIHSSDSYGVGSGGGATHIALESGLLSTFENKQNKLLIVGAGGGGAGYVYFASNNSYYSTGGSGGGYIGGPAKGITTWSSGVTDCPGATQSYIASATGGEGNRAATTGTFGQGGYISGGGASNTGGGGGYYGGTGCRNFGGSGGSGYIGNSSLLNKGMCCFNCQSSIDTNTKTTTVKESSLAAISNIAKEGNGYAKITYLGENIDNNSSFEIGDVWTYDYKETSGNGVIQSFTPPTKGIYKIEVWGAQGGEYSGYAGGYGAYSVGTIELNANQQVYVGVGGKGTCSSSSTNKGGYNGGGTAASGNGYVTCSGGGATHIALDENLGELKNYNTNQDKVVIIAGGGGGAAYSRSGDYGYGGHAGGIKGNGSTTNGNSSVYTTGGTQSGSGCYHTSYSSYNNSCNGGYGFGANLLNLEGTYHGGAGGGGYYGGGAPTYDYSPGGGGGSSYIGNNLLSNKYTYCYNCTTSPITEENTYTKSFGSSSCSDSNPKADCAKQGNGYARITLLEIK